MSVPSKEVFLKAINEAKRRSKKRNFAQSVELIVKLKDIDLKRPENRLLTPIYMPHVPPEKKSKVCVFATGDLALKAKDAGADLVLSREDLNALAGDKKAAKKLVSEYDFFLAQPDLMAHVGRILGRYLGPRGKIPLVLPPSVDVKAFINRFKNSKMLKIRNQPQAMCWIGLESQPDEEIAENALRVLETLGSKYNLAQNLDRVYVKLTMGPSVRVK
ncbi:MAG: 50S ribosomal protein L1 [Thermoprotei archaeon]|nr:MAG: 50S ribosomal protein L1 [Thermoprotei archaeon]RLF03484.1 MAG: 50S ribosomal protein L1 [Thermoprotei archaeon]